MLFNMNMVVIKNVCDVMRFVKPTLQASGSILKITEPKKKVYLKKVYLNNDLRLHVWTLALRW